MKKFLKNYKKKLQFFCPSIEEGGVEKNLFNIANKLSDDFDISIITANNNKKKFFNKKIKFISTKNKKFNRSNRFIKSLLSTILFIRNYNRKNIIFSFQSNIIAIFLSKIMFNKIIVRSNTSPNKYAKNLFKRCLLRIFFNFADKIVVNSKEFKNEFFKYFKINAVTIYNPVEKKNYLLKKANKKINFRFFNNSNGCIKVLSIGRLVEQKDHITILKAINKIKNKKKIKFCLIGKGYLEDNLKHYIKKRKLSEIVKIIGYRNNIYPYIKKADLFVLSSLYEGLPNILIEALSFGIPIFSTNCRTGPKEILKNYKNSKLFKIKDHKNLSKMLISFKPVKKNFTYDKRFDFEKNIQLYKNLINSI